jgi:ribosomal RNA-processing protein 36
MAISDILNRRVRARPDDEDDVYSSGSGEEVSQDENEVEEDVDSDDQSQEVCDLQPC